MPTFTYTGQDSSGQPITETVTAADRFAVYDIARTSGHTVNQVAEEGVGLSGRKWLKMDAINAWLSKVSDDELVMMTRNLGSMITAGLTVTRALDVIKRQSKNPKLKQVIITMNDRINRGDAFHETLQAFPDVFNDLYVSMVHAGEEGGTLAQSLKTLSLQMERSNNLKKKIKGAMIYPAIVVVVMVGIGILMMMYVLPQITVVFEGMNAELPGTTLALIATSNFLVENTLLALLSMVLSVVGFVYLLKTRVGIIASSWLIPRLPVIGTIAKEANAARTARTLSSLLQSGVDVIRSLEITEEVVQNVYYKEILQTAALRVEKGTPMSETFIENETLYPVLVGEMILVGEETGKISDMLGELAQFYEAEVERKTKDLSTIIEPLLMVVIGTVVGFFALAIIGPIYSIGDAI